MDIKTNGCRRNRLFITFLCQRHAFYLISGIRDVEDAIPYNIKSENFYIPIREILEQTGEVLIVYSAVAVNVKSRFVYLNVPIREILEETGEVLIVISPGT